MLTKYVTPASTDELRASELTDITKFEAGAKLNSYSCTIGDKTYWILDYLPNVVEFDEDGYTGGKIDSGVKLHENDLDLSKMPNL